MDHDASRLDILAWSHDPHLAAVRSLLLQKAGYNLKSVAAEDEFEAAFLHLHPRLLLLCQTIEEQECSRADTFAKEHDPGIRVMVIFNQRCKCIPSANGMLVRSGAGPVFLLETIHTLIGSAHTTIH